MLKNKIFVMVIGMLIAITLILAAAFFLWTMMSKSDASAGSKAEASAEKVKPAKQLSAAEIKDNTVILKDVLTNLANNSRFIKVSFAFELENKKAKAEFENLLDSKVKGTIIKILSDMTPEQVSGSKGYDNLSAALMNSLNPYLKEGKIKEIMITDIVLQ
ncbi:flagellar basal body protein FliL [Gordoniibacillus kamchatkensis]|uniref:Flagellar protein FliL n=1 Tax=Gordoniibacillus kamchatkensis TaxID=1590651 RepID=A0ABR5ADW5_9BACL|nr:flagellar basal body-associated FliL family protein [Paenibacillus sp. VKM B-2647]KIL39239.1 flagellar basal body protein FliL [Paenibacillus sp. VKM B-2647]